MANLLKKGFGLLAEICSVTLAVASEIIDHWGTGVSRDDVERRSRSYALRCAELEHQLNVALDDSMKKDAIIDSLKFIIPANVEAEISTSDVSDYTCSLCLFSSYGVKK